MFRQTLTAGLLIACQTSVAYSQPKHLPEAYIADLWQVYLNRCRLALEDQLSFLNSLPPTNTGGGPNAVLTADRALLVSSTLQNGFTVDVDIIALSSGFNVSCHVFPSSRMFELESFSAAEIEVALEQFLVLQELQKPSGGEIKNAFSGPRDGDEFEYNYFIELTMAGKTVLTRFEMTEGNLGVYFAGILVPASD